MKDKDIISEDERHEAASETPAFLGCPQHMPTHLPSGFDGVEPGTQGGEDVPDYEWLAKIMTRDNFDPDCLAKAIEAEASKRPIEYPTFYTPGWLVEIAKKLEKSKSGVEVEQRKHTMDFCRFHVTRAAIPGRTVLTFRRKQEVDEEYGSLILGRIIIATITRNDVGAEKPDHRFTVKSYEAGEKPRVLFAGDSWVCMSKTEKIVYKMVKCNIKETQRRHITRKRKRNAAKAAREVK